MYPKLIACIMIRGHSGRPDDIITFPHNSLCGFPKKIHICQSSSAHFHEDIRVHRDAESVRPPTNQLVINQHEKKLIPICKLPQKNAYIYVKKTDFFLYSFSFHKLKQFWHFRRLKFVWCRFPTLRTALVALFFTPKK